MSDISDVRYMRYDIYQDTDIRYISIQISQISDVSRVAEVGALAVTTKYP